VSKTGSMVKLLRAPIPRINVAGGEMIPPVEKPVYAGAP
jgi:hypothetical protein